VTYDDIVAIFMATPETPFPRPTLPGTPARRLRDAVEPIATQGWWSRPAGEHMTSLGLGFFDGYVWGRAAALGEPTAALVVATFGVVEPAMLTGVYEGAVGVASRTDVLRAREYSFTRGLIGAQLADAVASLEDRGLLADAALTPDGQRVRDAIEAATDQSQAALVTALGDDLEAVIDGADAISTAIVDAPAFPSDPRKRAAG
jgi:hypothetical protein